MTIKYYIFTICSLLFLFLSAAGATKDLKALINDAIKALDDFSNFASRSTKAEPFDYKSFVALGSKAQEAFATITKEVIVYLKPGSSLKEDWGYVIPLLVASFKEFNERLSEEMNSQNLPPLKAFLAIGKKVVSLLRPLRILGSNLGNEKERYKSIDALITNAADLSATFKRHLTAPRPAGQKRVQTLIHPSLTASTTATTTTTTESATAAPSPQVALEQLNIESLLHEQQQLIFRITTSIASLQTPTQRGFSYEVKMAVIGLLQLALNYQRAVSDFLAIYQPYHVHKYQLRRDELDKALDRLKGPLTLEELDELWQKAKDILAYEQRNTLKALLQSVISANQDAPANYEQSEQHVMVLDVMDELQRPISRWRAEEIWRFLEKAAPLQRPSEPRKRPRGS